MLYTVRDTTETVISKHFSGQELTSFSSAEYSKARKESGLFNSVRCSENFERDVQILSILRFTLYYLPYQIIYIYLNLVIFHL